MIKLEALRVFAAVATAGNIADAAHSLGRTPSAVSMTLKQLEQDVGAPLFAGDRKNALTELGAFLFEGARAQIAGFDRLVEAVRDRAEGRAGRLRLACVPSVAATLVPPLVDSFLAGRDGLQIELLDVHSASVAALVDSGEVDFGIAGRPVAGRPLAFRRLFCDRFMVICPADGPLARKGGPVDWADLAGQRLIRNGASDRIDSAGYRALAVSAPLLVRNVTSLVAMVSAGLGVTLLPALSVVHLPPQAVALPLADGGPRREVGLVERPGVAHSPVAEAFIRSLLAEAETRATAVLAPLGEVGDTEPDRLSTSGRATPVAGPE